MSTKTKVLKTSRSFRIWLEGSQLMENGFSPNTRYDIVYEIDKLGCKSDRIRLVLNESGKRKVTNSVRNGEPRPIIDIESKRVGLFADAGTELIVYYFKTQLVIMKVEQEKVLKPYMDILSSRIGFEYRQSC